MTKKRKTVRVEEEVWKKGKTNAKNIDVSISWVVRKAIKKFNQDPESFIKDIL